MPSRKERIRLIGMPTDSGFGLGLILTVLQGASAVALMGMSAWLISRAAEHPPVMYLNMAVVLVRGFALGRAFFRYTERVTLHDSAFKAQTKLRKAIYAKIVPLAPIGFASINRAKTVSSLVNDVDELQNLPLRVVAPLVQSAVVSLLTVGFLAVVQPAAALSLLFGLLAVAVIVVPLSAQFARAAGTDSAPARTHLAAESTNLLENLDVLEAYGWAESANDRVAEASQRVLRVNRRQAITVGIGTGALTFLASLTTAATTYFGAVEITQGGQPRVMLAVIALLPIALFDVITAALPAVNSWQRYRSSAAKVAEIESSLPAPEIKLGSGNLDLGVISSIELENIAATYPGENKPAISGFSLKLSSGEAVQLKGPSGSGKTTIAMVLSRFLNLTSGSYRINDSDAADYEANSLRTRIGYLEQSPTIFMGTLRDNLLIAKPTATDKQLNVALERVGLGNTFLGRSGLDTQLGERGFAISGGEAQRVALARALLADFQVLIFDEPTANVDPELAAKLWDDLLNVVRDDPRKAAVFITHESLPTERFSTVITL